MLPPPHPPCPHLAHPLLLPPRSARAVIVAANASNPGLFSAKSGIAGSSNVSKVPGRQKWQPTPHHSEHLHFVGAPGGSRWLQVVPGGSRWIKVDPGGSRRQETHINILSFSISWILKGKIVQVAKVHEISINIFIFNFLSTIFIFRAHLCPCGNVFHASNCKLEIMMGFAFFRNAKMKWSNHWYDI